MKNPCRLTPFLLIILLLFTLPTISRSQVVAPAIDSIIQANALSSGNNKDVLSRFFQLAFGDLTGPSKTLSLTGNPYALMLKKNPLLSIDKYYSRYQPLRRSNFNFGLKVDSNYKFNGFTSGLKYAIVDQTDATTSKFVAWSLKKDPVHLERKVLVEKLRVYAENIGDINKKVAFVQATNAFLQTANTPYSKLDPDFRQVIDIIIQENGLNKLGDVLHNAPDQPLRIHDSLSFANLSQAIKSDWLWTLSVADTTYRDKFQFASINLRTDVIKGLGQHAKGQNSFELNADMIYNFSTDSLKSARNLDRQILSGEIGLNWVVRSAFTDKSYFEFKLSGSYSGIVSHTSPFDSQTDMITLNATARIRVYADIWVPVEIKYDPNTGNVFGLLNVKANFTALESILKGGKTGGVAQ